MRVLVHAVGRMKAGPERELAARYFERFAKAGGAVGLDFRGAAEIAESHAAQAPERRRDEAARLKQWLEPAATLVLLDERGKSLSSEAFAEIIARRRDAGEKALAFALGGPDGHDPDLHRAAALVLSFGAMTWPHQLARIMLAEQLYRAATILSGHPYHRS
jgi:23S rRNA (pseudouridine1915-N3)-methyltransferase